MTHRGDSTAYRAAMEALIEKGFERMAAAMEVLLKEAMKLERSQFLGADPHELTEEQRGYANGYKEKTAKTKLGELKLVIPQVRDLEEGTDGFYPRSLERRLRSERALKLAIAEMYVEGVPTRKVQEITKELCGLDVTSMQVSRAANTRRDVVPE